MWIPDGGVSNISRRRISTVPADRAGAGAAEERSAAEERAAAERDASVGGTVRWSTAGGRRSALGFGAWRRASRASAHSSIRSANSRSYCSDLIFCLESFYAKIFILSKIMKNI